MRLCIFEDRRVSSLEPLTLTRPAFELRCGAFLLWQRQRRALPAAEAALFVRPELAELCRGQHPGVPVNAPDCLTTGATLLANARWLPSAEVVTDLTTPRVGLVGEEVAYVLPSANVPHAAADNLGDWVETCKNTLPNCPAGGAMIRYPWDLIEHNPDTLRQDLPWFLKQTARSAPPAHLAILGDREAVFVDASATVEPFVVADTRHGPVIIDRGALIHSFTRLEGPCYVGQDSWLLGTKLRGGSIGPQCRVGGEVEASILHGYSNKYHDGFLGHSYVGEWVNLAAGTQVSDLRNDYGEVVVSLGGNRIPTGLTKVGAFLGDHTKTGLNTLLNTGTVAGAFCNLLPDGTYLPKAIPSFCTYGRGQLQERWELRQMLQTADTVMRRRGAELSVAHTDFFFALFEQTAAYRQRVLRESDQRRWRRSISS